MTTPPTPPVRIPTTATKPLAERSVVDRSGPVAEVTTAVVAVAGRYAVDLSEDLTTANAVLDEVLIKVRRTDSVLSGPETLELRIDPDEFTALLDALTAANAVLFPTTPEA